MKQLNAVFHRLGLDPVKPPEMPAPPSDLADRLAAAEDTLNLTNVDTDDEEILSETEAAGEDTGDETDEPEPEETDDDGE